MDIGTKLKNLRLDRNFSVYYVSQCCGISQTQIASIEEGDSIPKIDTLAKILGVLGCTMSEFFNEDTDVFYLSPSEKKMLSQFRALSEEQQKTLADMTSMVFRTCTH